MRYEVWIFDGYTFYTIWQNYNDRKHDQKLEMVVKSKGKLSAISGKSGLVKYYSTQDGGPLTTRTIFVEKIPSGTPVYNHGFS